MQKQGNIQITKTNVKKHTNQLQKQVKLQSHSTAYRKQKTLPTQR